MFGFYVVSCFFACLSKSLLRRFQPKNTHFYAQNEFSQYYRKREPKRKNVTRLSCSRHLFSLFHSSLKSEENSCHTVKNVFGETSFSPPLGLTEKKQLSSRKLESIQRKAWHNEENKIRKFTLRNCEIDRLTSSMWNVKF